MEVNMILKGLKLVCAMLGLSVLVVILIYNHTEAMVQTPHVNHLSTLQRMKPGYYAPTTTEPQAHTIHELLQTHRNQDKCSSFGINETILHTFRKIKQKAVDYDEHDFKGKRILILTPLSDSANTLQDYFSLLCSLTYPHNLISVAIGEDSSSDKSYEIALQLSKQLQHSFNSVNVFKLKDAPKPGTFETRHEIQFQRKRRSHLAKSRNELLMNAMRSEYDWVLWLDSDVIYYPPNIIELLLSAKKDVVVPACLMKQKYNNDFIIYDKNTWKETESSLNYLSKKVKDFLMLEGYDPTLRKYISHLRDEGDLVEIDGVGGCTLLIRGSCHREGLVFPTFVYEHHIETEGLGKMAKAMGYSVYALPFVSVVHEN